MKIDQQMLIKILSVSVVLASLVCFPGCDGANPDLRMKDFSNTSMNLESLMDLEPTKTNLTHLIIEIKRQVVDLTDEFAVVEVKEFQLVYRNPSVWLEPVLQILGDSDIDDLSKEIVVLSLQRLPPNLYLKFLRSAYNFYNDQTLSSAVLRRIICPGIDWHDVTKTMMGNAEFCQLLKDFSRCEGLHPNTYRYLDVLEDKLRCD